MMVAAPMPASSWFTLPRSPASLRTGPRVRAPEAEIGFPPHNQHGVPPGTGWAVKRADALFSADVATGRFEGYASLFGLVDLGRDRILPGAFRETLAKRGPSGVKLLWQHDPATPLGRWLTLREDNRGLFVQGALDLSLPKAREVLALMQSGALDGLSIGFVAELARRDAGTGIRTIARVDLWEISLVTFPMQPQARVSAVKGLAIGALHARLLASIRRAAIAFAPRR